MALGGYARAVRHKAGEADALRAKDAFYEVLLAGANSPPLAETLTMLQGRVRLLRATSLSVPDRPAASVRELSELVDAIEQRDVARATAACTAHVRTAARTGIGRLAEIAES